MVPDSSDKSALIDYEGAPSRPQNDMNESSSNPTNENNLLAAANAPLTDEKEKLQSSDNEEVNNTTGTKYVVSSGSNDKNGSAPDYPYGYSVEATATSANFAAPPHKDKGWKAKSASTKRKESEDAIQNSIQNFIPFRSIVLKDKLIEDHSGWFPEGESDKIKAQLSELSKWLTVRNNVRLLLDYGHIQDTYASLDPDSETYQAKVASIGLEGRNKLVDAVFSSMEEILAVGEFSAATPEDLARAQYDKSFVGFNMRSPDPSVLQSKLWVRGTREVEALQTIIGCFRRTVKIQVFDRVVLAFQVLKPVDQDDEPLRDVVDPRIFPQQVYDMIFPPLGVEGLKDDYLYLKIFKDIPACDLDMLIPGSDFSMSLWDMLIIWVPILVGLGAAIYKAIKGTLAFHNLYQVFTSVFLIAVPLIYGIRWFFTYKAKRENYAAHLNRILLLHCLSSNGGVLDELLHEAQEQEDNECFLAYFFLWKGCANPEPTSQKDLDSAIEAYISAKIALAEERGANRPSKPAPRGLKAFFSRKCCCKKGGGGQCKMPGTKSGGEKSREEKTPLWPFGSKNNASKNKIRDSMKGQGGGGEGGNKGGGQEGHDVYIKGSDGAAAAAAAEEGKMNGYHSSTLPSTKGDRDANASEKNEDDEKNKSSSVRAKLDFEVDDAVAKLLRLKLIEVVPEAEMKKEGKAVEEGLVFYRAVPLEKALALSHIRNFNEATERGVALGNYGKSSAVLRQ